MKFPSKIHLKLNEFVKDYAHEMQKAYDSIDLEELDKSASLLINSIKIVFSTSIMSYIFHNSLNYFAKNLSYSSDYKILYLLFIVIFVALLYFLICYFLKVLNLRSFRTN